MTPEELYLKIRIFEPACDEVIPDNIKRDNEACVELIQQAKSEWENISYSKGYNDATNLASNDLIKNASEP